MNDLRFGIDIDGVLANWNDGFRDLLKTLHGKEPPAWPPQQWHWPDTFCSKKEVNAAWRHIDESAGEWWLSLDALGDGYAVGTELNKLDGMGDVYYLTARWGDGVKPCTETWLLEELDAPWPTVLIGLKPQHKASLVEALDIHVMVDDRVENLETVYDTLGIFRSDGKDRRLFLFNQPYNQDLSECSPGFQQRVERVSSIKEVREKCGG